MIPIIAEDFPDIAQRLKEIEAQKKRLIEHHRPSPRRPRRSSRPMPITRRTTTQPEGTGGHTPTPDVMPSARRPGRATKVPAAGSFP